MDKFNKAEADALKVAFANKGVKVRVRNFGHMLRVCTTSGAAFDQAHARSVVVYHGLTVSTFNQAHEVYVRRNPESQK